jgi:hypothetical protein
MTDPKAVDAVLAAENSKRPLRLRDLSQIPTEQIIAELKDRFADVERQIEALARAKKFSPGFLQREITI